MFESCKGDINTTLLKLAALRANVRKYGSSGHGRIGLFGTMVGWVHEQSYVPQVSVTSFSCETKTQPVA